MLSHVVLVGLDYQPVRATGDKNFWTGVVGLVAKRLDRITVFSLKRHERRLDSYYIGGCRIVVKYFPTRLLLESGGGGIRGRGALSRLAAAAEKALGSLRLLDELEKLYIESPYQHVHLMDNLGPANRIIAGSVPASLSVSAMTYKGIGPRGFYDAFLRYCYGHGNVTVAAMSAAFREKLRGVGVPPGRVRQIAWGVRACETLRKARTDGKKVVLWSGYIHPIGREDFFMALRAARLALEKGLKAGFVFAFKPECFEKGFEKLSGPEKGITVKATSVAEFETLKRSCDVMLSPVAAKEVILAPPLTWLELMGAGVPVVTTDVPGASEAVIDGATGLIARNGDGLAGKLFQAVDSCAEMAGACREHVARRYSLEEAAGRYLRMWDESRLAWSLINR